MKNKNEICVELTQKNLKKVYGALKMFPSEKIFPLLEKDFVSESIKPQDKYLYFDGEEWITHSDKKGLALIKPRELRNILFAEHSKEGDYVVCRNIDEDAVGIYSHHIDRGVCINEIRLEKRYNLTDKKHGHSGAIFTNFLRYATQEEIELLEGKTKESEKNKNQIEALINVNKVEGEQMKNRFLIEEAKSRGFEGRNLEIKLEYKNYLLESEIGQYQLIGNTLYYQGAPIFHNGKWAEIISQRTYRKQEVSIFKDSELVCVCVKDGYADKILSLLNGEK